MPETCLNERKSNKKNIINIVDKKIKLKLKVKFSQK
jgi:hypothetical protein